MTPFFNGQNPLDAFTASLLLASLYQTNLEGMQTVFGTIEPCEVTYFPGDLVTPPCAVIVSQNYVAVVCLGSVTWGQWILNFLGSAQVTLPPIPGQVSAYFGGAGLAITANISSLVTSAAPGRRVVFIGHSLGGAAVQISASVLPVPGSLGTAVWTFGAPCVGNGAFAASINSITQRWENTNDPIPAVPPQLWAGPGSVFPVPGPPPFALYVHAGVASTINADGSITPGSNPPSLSNVALQFASGDLPTHYPSAYAQRLLAGLPPSAFTNPDNGYKNAPLLVAFYNDFYGASFLIPTGGTQVAAKNRVTLFYSYAGYGMTESWYTDLTGFNLTQQISSYLLARMGLSVFGFEFVYARVTLANSNRLVSFYAPSTPGFTVHGSFGTAGVVPTTCAPLSLRMYCNQRRKNLHSRRPGLGVQGSAVRSHGCLRRAGPELHKSASIGRVPDLLPEHSTEPHHRSVEDQLPCSPFAAWLHDHPGGCNRRYAGRRYHRWRPRRVDQRCGGPQGRYGRANRRSNF